MNFARTILNLLANVNMVHCWCDSYLLRLGVCDVILATQVSASKQFGRVNTVRK